MAKTPAERKRKVRSQTMAVGSDGMTSPPKTPAERKRKEREARRQAGLVHFECWVTPGLRALLMSLQNDAPNMKRYRISAMKRIENLRIDQFLTDVANLCRQHGFSISHEDGHGAFQIDDFDQQNILWIMAALDNTSTKNNGEDPKNP